MTYNIARGKWLTVAPNLRRLERRLDHNHSVRAALRVHPELRDFDLLALQEVCSDRDGAHIATLGRLAPHSVFEPADNEYKDQSTKEYKGECGAGQMLISHHPVLASGRINLPKLKGRGVGRSAMWADLLVPDASGGRAPLRIYNLHLDNRGESFCAAEGRWVQMREVLKHIDGWRKEHPGDALLVVGDFNSLGYLSHPWSRERTIQEMLWRYDSALVGYTPTYALLSYQLDWIFYEHLQLHEAVVVDLLRSDHYPVVAEFVVAPRSASSREASPTPH